MKTQQSQLTKQITALCKAANLDQKLVLNSLLDSYEAIGSVPVNPQDLPAILPDYDCDGLTIELDRMVVSRDGKEIRLTMKEWKIMAALIKSDGKPISKPQLTSMIYDGVEPNSNTIEVFLSHLRLKVGAGVINTLRGIGYVLANKALLKSK